MLCVLFLRFAALPLVTVFFLRFFMLCVLDIRFAGLPLVTCFFCVLFDALRAVSTQ